MLSIATVTDNARKFTEDWFIYIWPLLRYKMVWVILLVHKMFKE